ncbi:muts domain V [Microdochium trichocladiopsis]|uniref:Muts domain V n=1 Tax=Microdochium trichocladiopsis TaxID=1682393 RepID=A0A9P8Y8Q6_9PEZI|nr:muts domain V [Microdochium trichocladiopsis]KAH7035044.1 muts domain V [Microdochium trichocladiopsis]
MHRYEESRDLQEGSFIHCSPVSSRLVSPSLARLSGPSGWWLSLESSHGQLIRGKKTRTTLSLDDLPQGPLPSLPETSTPRRRAPRRSSVVQVTETGDDIVTDPGAEQPKPGEHDEQDEQDDGPQYPTVVMQARRNMQKFDNCVLLTRVGGFYELYFGQADEYGPLLNLKVAQKKTSAGPVSMAGFPFFQLDKFLKTLVLDMNCYVAIAEEFPNDAGDKIKSGGLMHDRRVNRVITPGTLIDENFIDPYANNYVMAIHVNSRLRDEPPVDESKSDTSFSELVQPVPLEVPPVDAAESIGLAWVDVSTGQFYTQSTTLSSLSAILSRVAPREVVVDDVLESRRNHSIFSVLAEDKHLITFAPHTKQVPISEWTPMLETEVPLHTSTAFTGEEIAAGSLLLQYVKDRLFGLSIKLQPPLRHENLSVLTIDKNSMRALEIKQTIRDVTFRGSLLHAIRRTVTKGGARLLNTWLSAPSTSLDEIHARQDLVEHFIQNEDLRDQIIILLRRSHDSQRLVQKFAFGRGDADDMVALCDTIRAAENIVQLLNEQSPAGNTNDCCASLTSRIKLEDPLALAQRIRTSIDEEGLVQQHETEENNATMLASLAEDVVASEGTLDDAAILPKTVLKRKKPTSIRDHYSDENTVFMMRPEASRGLQKLHAKLDGLMQEKADLSESLQKQMGAASLTLRWTPNLGHIGHVKGKDARKAAALSASSQQYSAVSSSRSTRAMHIPEWTSLGQRIHQTRYQIGVEEQRIFADLRALVVVNLVKLRQNAAVLDELDIATSFAKLAIEQGLVRPVLNDGTAHTIIGGRHPTVEGGLREQGRTFTKNDCLVGTPGQGRVWLITGPNMAGKSTYLRQNALITILAQVGCYVPADHAEIGIVDAIFSRVGSADDLYRDQSTFMVEMLETAQILHGATGRSLVIMDEVGRGTTPEDGTAVAFASLHHLVTVNRCRALFATHFHGLAELVREKGMHVRSPGEDSSSSEGEVAKRGQAGQHGAVEMYCTDVAEDDRGGFVYVHKLRKGINRQSHALKVARLAGLPEAAVEVAREVLAKEQQEDSRKGSADYD